MPSLWLYKPQDTATHPVPDNQRSECLTNSTEMEHIVIWGAMAREMQAWLSEFILTCPVSLWPKPAHRLKKVQDQDTLFSPSSLKPSCLSTGKTHNHYVLLTKLDCKYFDWCLWQLSSYKTLRLFLSQCCSACAEENPTPLRKQKPADIAREKSLSLVLCCVTCEVRSDQNLNVAHRKFISIFKLVSLLERLITTLGESIRSASALQNQLLGFKGRALNLSKSSKIQQHSIMT